jgi:hypothetical protein
MGASIEIDDDQSNEMQIDDKISDDLEVVKLGEINWKVEKASVDLVLEAFKMIGSLKVKDAKALIEKIQNTNSTVKHSI